MPHVFFVSVLCCWICRQTKTWWGMTLVMDAQWVSSIGILKLGSNGYHLHHSNSLNESSSLSLFLSFPLYFSFSLPFSLTLFILNSVCGVCVCLPVSLPLSLTLCLSGPKPNRHVPCRVEGGGGVRNKVGGVVSMVRWEHRAEGEELGFSTVCRRANSYAGVGSASASLPWLRYSDLGLGCHVVWEILCSRLLPLPKLHSLFRDGVKKDYVSSRAQSSLRVSLCLSAAWSVREAQWGPSPWTPLRQFGVRRGREGRTDEGWPYSYSMIDSSDIMESSNTDIHLE